MNQTIMTILGTVLAVLLGIAAVSYIGPVFSSATGQGKANAVLQAMQQIATAAEMYEMRTAGTVPNGTVNSTHALVTGGYLKATGIPALSPDIASTLTYSVSGGSKLVSATITNQAVCDEIAKYGGAINCMWELPTGPGTVSYNW